jgi:hypothetical protein
VFTARYGLIPCIKQITFRLYKVNMCLIMSRVIPSETHELNVLVMLVLLILPSIMNNFFEFLYLFGLIRFLSRKPSHAYLFRLWSLHHSLYSLGYVSRDGCVTRLDIVSVKLLKWSVCNLEDYPIPYFYNTQAICVS